MKKLIIIFALSMFGIVSQILMKRGVHDVVFVNVRSIPNQIFTVIFNPYIITAMMIYVIGFIIYLVMLTKMQVSTLYPLTVAMSFALLAISSFFIFSETISIIKIVGMLSIIIGITMLAVSA